MVSTQTTDKCHRCKTHVPLTEEEINEIAQTNLGDYRDGEWHLLFARAVERAHGIKE